MSDRPALMTIPGLISNPERDLLRELSEEISGRFQNPVIVNLGIYLGASCYCCRVGAPNCILYGVDINGWDRVEGTDSQKRELNMTLLQGDSRQLWETFDSLVHLLFVDDVHTYDYVRAHMGTWCEKIPVGGIAAFHDAYYSKESSFYRLAVEVSRALDGGFSIGKWEEGETVDSTRWFRRVK